MNPRLKQVLNLIAHKGLRRKTEEVIKNPRIEIGGTFYSGIPLDTSPAGLSRHHNYPGGFVEHTVASVEIALALCDVTDKVYGVTVDRDLVVAGTVLHDIFKPLMYEVKDDGYSTTSLGERVDHLTLISAELIRRSFPLDLIHIVCAHHGGKAGSTWPRTLEALICHLADFADSQLNGRVLQAARFLSRTVTGEEVKLASSKDAFEIVQSKTFEGWDGVKKTVEKIKRKRLRSQQS